MKLKTKICPNCKSTNIVFVAGGEIRLFECVDCRFRSAIFPGKEINTMEIENINNK